MKEELHIGKMIQNKMKEERRSAHWLAEKLICSRSNIYKIYEKSGIDTILLFNICKLLNHDFFRDISVIYKKT